MKPVIKWAGGKARLANEICERFGEPCQGIYFEPFLGSAAVYLHRKAAGKVRYAVLSDINQKLIEAYRALRLDVRGVFSVLHQLPNKHWQESYYEIREAYNAGPWQGVKHAARFFWLNRAAFNGLYRENRKGAFNVPVGRYDRLLFPSEEHFYQVAAYLQDAELVSCDFREVLAGAGAQDQVYCDPPYVPLSETASFTSYAAEPFGMAEQESLAGAARDAAMRGAKVLISNHDLPATRDLYGKMGFDCSFSRAVLRSISRGGNRHVQELIAKSYPQAMDKF